MKKLYLLFLLLCLIDLVGVALSIFQKLGLKPSDGATLFAGLLAGTIVWWQGHLIRSQMQLQALIELEKEWNCAEMLQKRSAAWKDDRKPDKEHIEGVLEFLEKVSTLEKRGIVSDDLIWDTFGWYLWRYYYYSRNVIIQLRDDWTNATDPTLYGDLEGLWPKLIKRELAERNKARRTGARELTFDEIIEELERTRAKFVSGEKELK